MKAWQKASLASFSISILLLFFALTSPLLNSLEWALVLASVGYLAACVALYYRVKRKNEAKGGE